tara:strand:- start:83 stop:424 length:342 start_codon:yes stop_codon:yes gene_type:complete
MNQPQYESEEISFETGLKLIMSLNKDISEQIVRKCLKDEYNQYNSLGSYRGFATFILPAVKKAAMKEKKALQTLRRATPLIAWMNDILYRPPRNNKSLRYEELNSNFNKLKKT